MPWARIFLFCFYLHIFLGCCQEMKTIFPGTGGSSGHFWKRSRRHYEYKHFGYKTFKHCVLQVEVRPGAHLSACEYHSLHEDWGFLYFRLSTIIYLSGYTRKTHNIELYNMQPNQQKFFYQS